MKLEQTPKGKYPPDWSFMPLNMLNGKRSATVNPQSHAEETFEYYSIPAYQDSGIPSLTTGSEIESSKLLLEVGTVLFGKLNPRVEKVWKVGNHYDCRKIGSTEWIPVYPTEEVNGDFLYYLFWSEHVMPKAKTLVSGSTPSRQRVDPRAFYQIQVPVPSLPEQLRIANALSIVQAAIEQQARLIALTSELKTTLMYKLFTQGLRGEKRKMTEIGLVPESWEVLKIGDVFKFSSGKTRPSDIEANPSIDKPFPVYGGNGVMGYSDKYLLEKPTLVLGRVGEYCGVAHHTQGKAWISDNALYTREINREVNTEYAAEYFTFANLNQYSNKAGQPLITQGVISAVSMPLPKIDEQEAINQYFDLLNRKSTNLQSKKTKLEELFRTLLHQLMTGQTRVNGPEFDFLDRLAE